MSSIFRWLDQISRCQRQINIQYWANILNYYSYFTTKWVTAEGTESSISEGIQHWHLVGIESNDKQAENIDHTYIPQLSTGPIMCK